MSQSFMKQVGYGNAFVAGETPAGNVDSSNTLYTCADGYIGGSLMVHLNGQRKFATDDYFETSPGSGTFTFVTAPATGASVRVDYMKMNSVAGNADTVDGLHGTDLIPIGGWVSVSETWTYASANTITIPAGGVAKYEVGDKIHINQSGTKYFYVTLVADTLLTVYAGTDYTVANAAITNPAYSKVTSPDGFPQWFDWTPTYGANYTSTSQTARFCVNGRSCTLQLATAGTVGGASGVITWTLPIVHSNLAHDVVATGIKVYDAGERSGTTSIRIDGITMWAFNYNATNWGVGAGRRFFVNLSYEI